MPASLAHQRRMLSHLERQQNKQSRLHTEAQRALTELRRVRDIFAKRDEPAETARINARILALKEALA